MTQLSYRHTTISQSVTPFLLSQTLYSAPRNGD